MSSYFVGNIQIPHAGIGVSKISHRVAFTLCWLAILIACAGNRSAEACMARETCSGSIEVSSTGWWSGSSVFGDTCACQFNATDLQRADWRITSPLEAERYDSCEGPLPGIVKWVHWSSGNYCRYATWYQSENWDRANIFTSVCRSGVDGVPCTAFYLREDGCAASFEDEFTEYSGEPQDLADNERAFLVQFVELPMSDPANSQNGLFGGWKLSFDTRCVLAEGEGADDEGVVGGCTELEGGIKSEGADNSLVQIEIYCGADPSLLTSFVTPDIASVRVPPYDRLTPFEFEFYAPDDGFCRPDPDADGSYAAAIVFRFTNDKDLGGNQICVEPDPDNGIEGQNHLWRVFELSNIKLAAIYVAPSAVEQGLADYQRLAAMEPSADDTDALARPVVGGVDFCENFLVRTAPDADSTSNPDATPEDPCIDNPYDTPTPEPGGTPPESTPQETVSEPLRMRLAPLWHPPAYREGVGTPETAQSDPYFYVSPRPDLVLPWSQPYSDWVWGDEEVTWSVPDLPESLALPARKWVALHNPTTSTFEWIQFTLPEDWRVYEVIYMPEPITSQSLSGGAIPSWPQLGEGYYVGAYRIRPTLLQRCMPSAIPDELTADCSFPLGNHQSRSYVLEVPPGVPAGSYEVSVGGSGTWDALYLNVQRIAVDSSSGGGVAAKPLLVPVRRPPGGIPGEDEGVDDYREVPPFLELLKRHGIAYLMASAFPDRVAGVLDAMSPDYTNPEYWGIDLSEDSDFSVVLNLGSPFGLSQYTGGKSFEAVGTKIAVEVFDDKNTACSPGESGFNGGRCPYQDGAVALLIPPDFSSLSDLAVGDYLTCGGKTLARVGALDSQLGRVYLDVPFPNDTCRSRDDEPRTFYRVQFSGWLDQAIIKKVNTLDEEFISQSSYCCRDSTKCNLLDEGLVRPISCQDPNVSWMALGYTYRKPISDHPRIEPGPDWPSLVAQIQCERPTSAADDEWRCWLDPELDDLQLEALDTALWSKITAWYRDPNDNTMRLGPKPVIRLNQYSEPDYWYNVFSGEFDGFGQSELIPLSRYIQTQCNLVGSTGMARSCGSTADFPHLFMESLTTSFLYYFTRSATAVDSDGDGDADADETSAYRYCATNTDAVCTGSLPIFMFDASPGSSRFADQWVAEALPSQGQRAVYNGGYYWALQQPPMARYRGLYWSKVASTNLGQADGPFTVPNSFIYPGSYADKWLPFAETIEDAARIVGSWDTLPLVDVEGELVVWLDMPTYLPDRFGRYGFLDSAETDLWGYDVESVSMSSILDQLNDAHMAAVFGLDLTSSERLPYGPQFSIRNGSHLEGVCFAEKLLEYGVAENGGRGLLNYDQVRSACSEPSD